MTLWAVRELKLAMRKWSATVPGGLFGWRISFTGVDLGRELVFRPCEALQALDVMEAPNIELISDFAPR